MPVYTFYLHEGENTVPAFEITEFDSADAALAHARRLLQDRRRYTFIEIVGDDDSLVKLTRAEL